MTAAVLQGPAMALRQEVRAGSIHLKDRLSIELQPDNRKGAIRYGNDYFSAKVIKVLDAGAMLIKLFESEINFILRHFFSHCLSKAYKIWHKNVD